MLPQSPLPPSLGKEVRSIKLPDMPMGAISIGATIHNSKVYISAMCVESTFPVLVYSANEHKWNALEAPVQHNRSAIAVVNNHITLIGGVDTEADEATNTLSTWYEEDVWWKQILPPVPTRRGCPAVITHDNLLLVTGGADEDVSTVLNTTDVLDLTTMKWTTPEGLSLPVPLWHHHLALCGEYLYLVGGSKAVEFESLEENSQAWRAKWSDVKQTAAPQHSQPQRGVWTQIADPPTLRPTAVSCGGTLYTVRGVTRDGKPISTVYTYNTARNQWASVGDLCVGRAGPCAVPLSSTSIFVAGGRILNEDKESYSPLTEILLL